MASREGEVLVNEALSDSLNEMYPNTWKMSDCNIEERITWDGVRWEFCLFFYTEGRGTIGLRIADWLNGLQAGGNVLQVTMFETGGTDGVMAFAQVSTYGSTDGELDSTGTPPPDNSYWPRYKRSDLG